MDQDKPDSTIENGFNQMSQDAERALGGGGLGGSGARSETSRGDGSASGAETRGGDAGGRATEGGGDRMGANLKSYGVDTDRMSEAANEHISDFQRMLTDEVRARPLRALGWAAAAGLVFGFMTAR